MSQEIADDLLLKLGHKARLSVLF